MTNDIAELVNLPWATLLALASGYAGYYVANAGLRAHHKSIDIAFSTIVFGFFGSLAFQYLVRADWGIMYSSLGSFAAAIFCGILWNKIGRSCLEKALRISKVSYSDELPSAWKALFASTDTCATQLTLKLTDGTWLHCNDLNEFRDHPNGPCTLGDAGDVLMYVTHRIDSDGREGFIESDDLIDEKFGTDVTYIPKDKIERMTIRRSHARVQPK